MGHYGTPGSLRFEVSTPTSTRPRTQARLAQTALMGSGLTTMSHDLERPSADNVAVGLCANLASMNTPRKHHYSPEFYLKQWAGGDGRLCVYSRLICENEGFSGRIETRRKSPGATGYEWDLYRVEGLPEAAAHLVETKFMGMVDTDAARALDKIISGDETPWDERVRSAWTRFILSLRFRNPGAVHENKQQMKDVWRAGVDNHQANYDKLRLPIDPPTFDEVMALTTPEAPHKAAFWLLQDIIDNERVGQTISRMHWTRVSLAASKPSPTYFRPPARLACGAGGRKCLHCSATRSQDAFCGWPRRHLGEASRQVRPCERSQKRQCCRGEPGPQVRLGCR
jgi:hypothetical protein